MKIEKTNVYMSRISARALLQITLDEDKNIPEGRPDMGRLITQRAVVELDPVECREEKAEIRGRLNYRLLYAAADDAGVHGMAGEVAFREPVRLSGAGERDMIYAEPALEDLTIEMVHARKIRVQALLTFHVTAEGIRREEFAVQVQSEEPLEQMTGAVTVTSLAAQKKEMLRVREMLTPGAGKPPIEQILWDEISVRGITVRPADGRLEVSGELNTFLLYYPEGDGLPLQWQEFVSPFTETIEIDESREGLLAVCDARLIHTVLALREPETEHGSEGEERFPDVEAVLELYVRLYEEQTLTVIKDLYSPVQNVVLEEEETALENIRMFNQAKCKVSEKISLPENERIFQICHADARIVSYEAAVVEAGLRVDGVLAVTMLYASADDSTPLKAARGTLPFTYMAEAGGAAAASSCRISAGIETLTIVMLSAEEAEVRAAIRLDILIPEVRRLSVIRSAATAPYDENKLREMPGLIGYVVQGGDTLWKIAKSFYTTVESIRMTNPELSEEPEPGDRIVLVKQAEELAGL